MTEADIAAVLRETMLVLLRLAAPPLAAGLSVGLLVSVFQTLTQVNEATLAYVPKLLALLAVLMLSGSFMLATLEGFTRMLFDRMVVLGGS
ncbi:MAG: flagellar biosynthetic protein FliQ [Acetobacteraceae bacterium]